MWKRIAAAAAVAATVSASAPRLAGADDVSRAKSDAGMGAATVVANVFYIPVKLAYAVVGGVTGGLGYVVTGGNKQVAERVWVSSFGGDYVLSRDQLEGRRPIQFSGQADPDM